MENENIKHPSHYTKYGVEVIEITKHMSFCRGNVVKYCCRAGLKDPTKELEDLLKAREYLDYEIELVRSKESPLERVTPSLSPQCKRSFSEWYEEMTLPGNFGVLQAIKSDCARKGIVLVKYWEDRVQERLDNKPEM